MAWGAEVIAADLPTDRPDEGADFFAREVASQIPPGKPPIVLAHSAAGLILPVVASHIEVERLVYLAAVIPLPGSSFVTQFKSAPEMFHPDWPGKDPTRDHDAARQFLFHDCDERIQAWALTTLRLWASSQVLTEPCPLRHMPEVPTTYISARQDRTINPEWWERAAEARLGVKPTSIDSGHAPHVSRPRELAKLIIG